MGLTPGSPAAAASAASIDIDVAKLPTASDLKQFLTGGGSAIFKIGAEIARFADAPIQQATQAQPAQVKITGNPSWTLPAGVIFSLSLDARCKIAVGTTSTKFTCKKSLDADDTMDVVAGPTDKTVYINIDLDFDIKGNLSGSGTAGGVGISGKASGSKSASFSFCYPVAGATTTRDAVTDAFAALVFPLQPDCLATMPAGSVSKVNFDGALNVELDLTYGFGNYKFSAQNFGAAQNSVKVAGTNLEAPTLDIETGAKGSVAYKHSDNFCAIVKKPDANNALLFLTQASSDEVSGSVGVNVGISLTAPATAKVDSNKMAGSIATQVKTAPPNLASNLASQAVALAPKIESDLVSKANKWLSDNDVGLTATLSREKDRTMLYEFKVDLSTASAQAESVKSWTFFLSGDLRQALTIPGFTLQPGSGVAQNLKQSTGIQLHFFNFHLATNNTYFDKTVVKLGPDGSIRLFTDLGRENQFTTKTASATATIHFVATGTEDPKTQIYHDVEVDLCIELSEQNDPDEATRIAEGVAALGAGNANVSAAEQKMLAFAKPNMTLCLSTVFKSSAYGKLKCSPFVDGKPPALPQAEDGHNYDAFHNMVVSLMPNEVNLASPIDFPMWQKWNVWSNDQIGAPVDAAHLPNRRAVGDHAPVSQHLFPNDAVAADYYFMGSTEFMNMCDHLQTLAGITASVTNPDQWEELIATLAEWVKADGNPDWSKPALAALLFQCGDASKMKADFDQNQKDKKMTCTLTLS